MAGTARQAVTDDYMQRLYRGRQEADAAMQLEHRHSSCSWTTAAPLSSHFSSCPKLNVSVCPLSQQQSSFPLLSLLYNPLARWRQAEVVLPVSASGGLAVLAADGVSRVTSQLQPAVGSEAWTPGLSAPYELRFMAAIPPLGYSSFFIVNDTAALPAASLPPSSGCDDSHRCIENALWLLSVNASSGLPVSMTDKQQNLTFPFSVDFLYYAAGEGSSPYGFRPNGSAVSLSSEASLQQVLVGPVSSEVRVDICSFVSAVFRLVNASEGEETAAWLEVDWVVGPVPHLPSAPLGLEVIVRYSAPDTRSAGSFYTDSNGREWQQRRRDYRPTWNLTRSEPESQNYYPVVTGMYIQAETSTTSASPQALLVLVDRAQGGSSLREGDMELMLHRRLSVRALAGEALDEQEGGRPLVVRGLHSLLAGPVERVLTLARTRQQRLQSPLSLSLATLQQQSVQQAVHSYRLTASYCKQPLPEAVELASLYSTPDGSSILRLQHQYGLDEQQTGRAQPVTLSIADLLQQNISSITQLSLTANTRRSTQLSAQHWRPQRAADAERHRHDRSASGLSADGSNVTILPMEVLTFNVTFEP